MKHAVASRTPVILIAFAVAAFALVAGIGASRTVFKDHGPGQPRLDVSQTAAAEDRGIAVVAHSAAFSGSGTFVLLSVMVDETIIPGAVGVHIPPDAFAGESLRPPGQTGLFMAPDGVPGVARFGPVVPGSAVVLEFRTVEVLAIGQGPERIQGHWRLELDAPADLAARVRHESLAGNSASTHMNLRVTAEGGQRSLTETLVTVRVDPVVGDSRVYPVEQALLYDQKGGIHRGVLIDRNEGGRLLTFTFPPTAFGSNVTVRIPSLGVVEKSDTSATISVNMRQIIARHGLRGDLLEGAPVLPADIFGDGLVVRRIEFNHSIESSKIPTIMIEVEGAYVDMDADPRQFSLTSASGEPLRLDGAESRGARDPAGVTIPGVTRLYFRFDDLSDVDGILNLTVGSDPMEIVRGPWDVRLSPITSAPWE